jgi:hypothetical protein
MDMRPHPRVIAGAELAEAIGVPEYRLEQLAALACLDLHHSQAFGLWAKRDRLADWRRAADLYPRFRAREP